MYTYMGNARVRTSPLPLVPTAAIVPDAFRFPISRTHHVPTREERWLDDGRYMGIDLLLLEQRG